MERIDWVMEVVTLPVLERASKIKGKSHAVNDMKSREVFGISMKCMKVWGLALEKKLNCASKALKTIK